MLRKRRRQPNGRVDALRKARHMDVRVKYGTTTAPGFSIFPPARKRAEMPYCHLRVYHGPEEAATAAWVDQTPAGKRCVTVPVGEVLPLLADAITSRRTWLGDFNEDEMTISTDLYEVLLSYQHFRRPSA